MITDYSKFLERIRIGEWNGHSVPQGLKNRVAWTFPYLAVAFAYIIFGKLGLQLASIQPNATAVWMPTGIAIASLLIFGYRAWPAIFIGAFLTNITTAGTFLTSLGIATGNTLEAMVAVYLINRFANGRQTFDTTRNFFKFCFFAGGIGPAISATIGVTTLYFAGLVQSGTYSTVWSTWWLGDLGGALIVAPVLLLWFVDSKIVWNSDKTFNTIIFAIFMAFSLFLAFRVSVGFGYFFIPVLIWAAFQFNQREIATAVFVLTEISLFATLRGLGPFAYHAATLNEALIQLQISMATTFMSVMALTIVIAEQRKVSVSLANTNERISREKALDLAILSSIGEGLIVTNEDGTIILTNPQTEAMLGRTSEELIGKKYHESIPMKDEDGNVVPLRERPIYRALTTGKRIVSNPLAPDQYYERKDGTHFPVSYTKTPVMLDGATIGTIEVFRDITKGKEIDQAKSDFVSLASHQLRTPLSIISMYSQLLLRAGKLFEKHNEDECLSYAGEIQEATKRMSDLINDLLNASRIDTRTLEVAKGPVDLKKLGDSIFDEMSYKIKEKKLKVRKNYGKKILGFTTDAQLLRIALQNLVSNAVKYTPPKGTISLTIVAKRSKLAITVSDTGYGIPKEQQGEIFKKLFRADNARMIESEGTGLGLYIAKSIASRLGGEIFLRSKENRGSTFSLMLPIKFPSSSLQSIKEVSSIKTPIYEEA